MRVLFLTGANQLHGKMRLQNDLSFVELDIKVCSLAVLVLDKFNFYPAVCLCLKCVLGFG